jgi:iron(III) transport system substrate-binding protein
MRRALRRLAVGLCITVPSITATPASAQGTLNMLCAPAAAWCEAIITAFQRDTGIKINMTRKSAGEILAQVRAEAQNPKTDIWFGASTDTHFVAAEGDLLLPYTSPNMGQLHGWAQKAHAQIGGRCVGVSSTTAAITYNTELLAKKNLPAPASWQDLLKPVYKGEVQMPNPNSSGTAYTIIAGLVQLWGEDKAFEDLKQLHANINTYTRSGSAPMKAASRGETGVGVGFDAEALTEKYAGFPVAIVNPSEGAGYEVACMAIIKGTRNEVGAERFYDWYLTGAAMDIGPKTNEWHQPSHTKITPNDKLPDVSKIKQVDYDFAKYGSAATRKRLIERWDREIGSLPR